MSAPTDGVGESGADDVIGEDRWDGEDLATRVLYAVAEAEETDPICLPQLQDSIDMDFLNALQGAGGPAYLSFEYSGYMITVTADGAIQLRAQEQSGD